MNILCKHFYLAFQKHSSRKIHRYRFARLSFDFASNFAFHPKFGLRRSSSQIEMFSRLSADMPELFEWEDPHWAEGPMRTSSGIKSARVALIVIAFAVLVGIGNAEAAIVRELQVGVAVSPSYKTSSDWQEKFKQRLAYASKIFETEFKIGFKPVAFMDWSPANETDMDALFEDLRNHFPLQNFDLVIGLSSVKKIPPEFVHDSHIIGRARPFSGYLVLRHSLDPLFKIQEETVLTHELGHLFGAIHIAQENSIMSVVIDKQIPTHFDSANRQIVELTRGIDFKRGDESLDMETIQRLLNAYLKLINEGQPFEFFYALGNFYVKLGQAENALQTWKKAVELNDRNGPIHYDLGVLSYKLGKPDEAITYLNRAISLFGSGKTSFRESAFHMLGNAYFSKKNYDSAMYAWREAQALSPNDLDLLTNMGIAEFKQGKFGDAIDSLERAIRLGSRSATIYQGLGAAYFETSNYQKAIENLKQALDYAPNQNANTLVGVEAAQPSQIHNQLAYAYMKLGDQPEALAHFEIACKYDASIECHRRLGQIYYEANRWDDAIRELSAVAGAQDTNADIYGMLGVALVQKNDYEKAALIFQEALRHVSGREEQAKFHTNLGNLYLRAAHHDLAEREFRFAIDKSWNSVEAYVGLAVCYLRQSDPESARNSLKQALTIDSQNTAAKDLLSQIEARLAK